MKSIIKMLELAFFATLAFSTVGALGAGSASAAEPQILLNGTHTFPQLILGSSSLSSKLVNRTATVECGSLLIHGLIRSKLDILLLLLWHRCKIAGTTTECNSINPTEPRGLIHTAVLLLPRLLLTHLPGFLIQRDPELRHVAEFECGALAKSIVVEGTVEAHLSKPAANVFSNEVTVNIEVKTAGSEQTFTHDEGSNEIMKLESSTNGFAFETATEEVLEAKAHLNSGVEVEFHC
jgi:hypothetical protein